MSGIAAIHYPLRDVDPSAGNVGLLIQVGDFVNRAAVNAHPHFEFRMTLERFTDLHSAKNRRFRAGAKNERATVARRQAQQLAFCLGQTELLRAAHDLFVAFESARSAR